jgi:hypothetical protein
MKFASMRTLATLGPCADADRLHGRSAAAECSAADYVSGGVNPGSGPTRDGCRTTHAGPDQTAGSNRGMAKSKVRTIRGKNPVGWKRPCLTD